MTEQSINTTKAHLGEPMSFMGVTHRNLGEGLPIGAWGTGYLQERG